MIGIRQADGSFYEILDETAGHKRLVLSAARTDQKGVRIELFRSFDGAVSEDPLGVIALEDPEGLGYKDIEFRVDLSDGHLDASAALPGQPARTLSVDLPADDDAPRRSDASILEDDALGTGLDTLDDSFLETEAEPATLDLPDLREDEPAAGTLPESFDMPDLEDDFGLPGLESEQAATAEEEASFEPEPFSLPEEETPGPAADAGLDAFDLPSMDEEAPAAAEPEESFDMPSMDDLGDLTLEEPAEPGPETMPEDEFPSLGETVIEPQVRASETAEDAFSLDDLGDMEPMEFMDTGAELSSPTPRAAPAPESAETESEFGESEFDVSMDSDSASEFGELPELDHLSDLDDLPGMEETPRRAAPAPDNDEDLDFMAPPELTETPWADEDAEETPLPSAKAGRSRGAKPAKAPKARGRETPVPAPQGGGLDKTALFLSLTSLSLLVLLILVLLFLNMVKSPQTPAVHPEVLRFAPAAPLAERHAPAAVDLAAGTTFEASTVLEIPAALRTAEVSLTLPPGDTAGDAQRRFGAPAKIRGNQLFW